MKVANLARMAWELDCELELLRLVEIPEIIVNTYIPSLPLNGPLNYPYISLRFPGRTDCKDQTEEEK
jgi:hypothetical protein